MEDGGDEKCMDIMDMDTTPMALALVGDVAGVVEEAGVEDVAGELCLAIVHGQDCQEDGDGCIPMDTLDMDIPHMAMVLHKLITLGTTPPHPMETILHPILSPMVQQMKKLCWRTKLGA